MKRPEITLDKLEQAIENKEEIQVNGSAIDPNQLIIIKRDGRKVPYDQDKMRKVVRWATGGSDVFADELLRDVSIKFYNEIKITDLYDEVIRTAANKISLLYPQWETFAAKLLLIKIYKETWGMKKEQYPHWHEVLSKGVSHKIYDKEIVESYKQEEIDFLDENMNQARDFLFTYKSLVTFYEKYCLNYSKLKKLELPQHVYMRISMTLWWKSDKKTRLANVIETYNNLSNHVYTTGTPISINAMTPKAQLASCVLNQMTDDTVSILDTVKNLSIYSKFKGGTAVDVSQLRARGSYILGNQGSSSGPVPFIKIVESGMKAFNQGGKRPGSCCVYFQWWHIDVEDMVVLKSNGGTDENRARGLKYAVKLNDMFLRAVVNDDEVSLFDPKDVTELFGIWGDEFDQKYAFYESRSYLKKKRVRARDLWAKIMKERSETGNIYLFHEENVNDANMTGRYVNSSNLCTEILEPSRASEISSEKMITNEDGTKEIIKTYDAGEIALCNLASINLVKYFELKPSVREKVIRNLVASMDNTIDVAHYPVKEGAVSNKRYRYLGIGVSNYANELAVRGITIDQPQALYETHKIFDELSFIILASSCQLAIDRGAFPGFFESEWSRGKIPLDFANKKALSLGDYDSPNDWAGLRQKIRLHGIRNALTMAIAPTATSGKAINATESIEPIQNLFYREEGTFTVPTIVPNFRKNNQYYKKSFDLDQQALIKVAAVRQCYLDQAQSVNLYYRRPDSLLQLTKDHLLAFDLGVKTLYYLKQEKEDDIEECESCT